MSRWPHDDPASLAAFYGDPATGEPGRHLVPVVPPFKMYYEGQPIKSIMFHVKAADALKAALDAIWQHYGCDQAVIDKLGLSKYSGAYNHRLIRGSATRWSNHAYGAAIDLNAEANGFNTGHGTMPQAVVDAFKAQGALWGGDYKGRTDPMHFEFCSREAIARPVALVGDGPQTDSDSDGAGGGDDDAAPAPSASGSGFFGRVRNWVVAGASSLGFSGLGFLTDWHIAIVFFAFITFLIVAGVGFVIAFFGADPVREFVRRHLT